MQVVPVTSTALVRSQPLFTPGEEEALFGFLAGYSGLTREAYALDLRQYVQWCTEHRVALFCARRADIEALRPSTSKRSGRPRATIARRLCTIACFYRYAEQEGLIARLTGRACPAARAWTTSRTRPAWTATRSAPCWSPPGSAAPATTRCVSLLALNGLRVSEAIGADIERLGLERGHRTLTIVRKGGKIVTIPLAPRTARAVDLAVGERSEGPIFLGADGARLDRHAAGRIVRRIARRAGINKRVGPHTLRHAFITAALDAGVPLATSKKPPATPTRARRCATTAPGVSLDRHATYIVATFIAGAAR